MANDTVGDEDVVVFWQPGTLSPLDRATTASGRDVGAAAAISRTVGEQTLTFVADHGTIIDNETASRWNVFGVAERGPLIGTKLTPVISINHFWFSWAAFKPETRIY